MWRALSDENNTSFSGRDKEEEIRMPDMYQR